ncbi:ArsR/SmtB family transcription factor [Cohnella caldifontis]|uniref:ArsR/SmtB family transcription factor n=1 Tax=Cohnella caldifontis TaxID=3027471 RepID=UPI0023EB9456|nr:metalloregulator ArsR/SmtB family transcription factor [Cohnella sp. YIM B05605]
MMVQEGIVAELTEMAELLKILGEPMRLAILALLQERELSVTAITKLLQASQPNTSQHLRKLRSAGLIRETKRGQFVYYSLNLEEYPDLKIFLSQLPGRATRLNELAQLTMYDDTDE